MTKYTRLSLLKTKKEIVRQVEEGKLGVNTASHLLGITRQGLWKLRKNYREHGLKGLVSRKRGPKSWFRVHNRTPEWMEKRVEQAFTDYGGGPDTLLWIMEDCCHDKTAWIRLSRSTIYRILVRRRLLTPKNQEKINHHPHKYTKGYPGEEVQLDTTEPFGKGNGIMLNAVDDYSRWSGSYCYPTNNSLMAKLAFDRFVRSAPFPIEAVRVDNGSECKKHFQRYCRDQCIRIIRNPIRTPEHNGKVERLHRTVEEECLWRIDQNRRQDYAYLNYELAKYTAWYNTRRRHLGYRMNRQTPQQKIEDWILNNKTSQINTGEVNETLILYISPTHLILLPAPLLRSCS